MGEVRYLISDAAKMLAVEAHVLRYWEEELELSIGRTELGHRYYTRENMEMFQTIKKLKEEGLQLKAIKVILQEVKNPQQAAQSGREYITQRSLRETAAAEESGASKSTEEEWDARAEETPCRQSESAPENAENERDARAEETPCGQSESAPENAKDKQSPQETDDLAVMESNAEKLRQFQELVEGIVGKVVRENNEELQRRMEESLAKETDYLLHMQERREEERLRKLDEAIRAHQKNRRYVAAAKEKGFFGRLFGK